ncbi:MAG TPA: DUF3105 domain-containing protein [Candidatus Limnocylindria bacterium]|jgi:hypothetical protein|nr:DUF3105 domain-containing protein [Candidatus Limnocylindria bacterium]
MATELRRDRREKQKRQRQRHQHQRHRSGRGIPNQLVMGGVIGGAILLALVGLRWAGALEPPAAPLDLNAAEYQVPAGATIGTLQPDQGRQHINSPQRGSYTSLPPTSGDHWSSVSPAAPAPWGIKDSTLDNEVTVHNLEHGGIVIVYKNLTPAETDQLKGIARSLMNVQYRKIILEPYPALTDAKVAVTAWRWLLKLQSVDQTQIVQFVRAHYSDPNYAPEPNVP